MGSKLEQTKKKREVDAAALEHANIEGQKDQADHNRALETDIRVFDSDDAETKNSLDNRIREIGGVMKNRLSSAEEVHTQIQEITKSVFAEGADIEKHNVSVSHADGNYSAAAEAARKDFENREAVYESEKQITDAVITEGKAKIQNTISGYK